MKKSNNKRTKRLRLKYKKTKTKRNIKRRTLRKTRRRQRGGILPSTSSVGRVMFNTMLSALSRKSVQSSKRVMDEITESFVQTFKDKPFKPFGNPTAEEKITPTCFFNELGKTIKDKLRKKFVKEIMDIILPSKPDKPEFTSANIGRAISYRPTSMQTDFSQKKSIYPINMYKNINKEDFDKLKREIDITVSTPDAEIEEKIEAFVDALIQEKEKETSHCNRRTPGNKNSAPLSMVEDDEED